MKTMIYFLAALMLSTIALSNEIKNTNEMDTEEQKAETKGKYFQNSTIN